MKGATETLFFFILIECRTNFIDPQSDTFLPHSFISCKNASNEPNFIKIDEKDRILEYYGRVTLPFPVLNVNDCPCIMCTFLARNSIIPFDEYSGGANCRGERVKANVLSQREYFDE